MSAPSILHVSDNDKFLPPLIQLIEQEFGIENHLFLLKSGMADGLLALDQQNVKVMPKSFAYYWQVAKAMQQADKIMLHSIGDSMLVRLLFMMPWVLPKCHWVFWGSDLYIYESPNKDWKWKINEFFRRRVIKKIGFLVNEIPGEQVLVRDWYGAQGHHYPCFAYLSNVFHPTPFTPEAHDWTAIIVGNSADPSNHHLEMFELLKPYADQNIRVYVPLTYGAGQDYIQQVIVAGETLFGENFYPLQSHMAFDDYLKLLTNIDIAVFGHRRQQAMGNIRTLLGFGKKVFMRQELTSAESLALYGIKTFDLSEFSIEENFAEKAKNQQLMQTHFSVERLKRDWEMIFTAE